MAEDVRDFVEERLEGLLDLPVEVVRAARASAATDLGDRKSTRLNSSHTEIYTLSLHDALPIYGRGRPRLRRGAARGPPRPARRGRPRRARLGGDRPGRSEEHTSELQSHRDLHSFPTRRSSDLWPRTSATSSRSGSRASSTCPSRSSAPRAPRRRPTW